MIASTCASVEPVDTILTVMQWLLPLLYLGLVIDYGATFFLRVRTDVREKWIPAIIVVHVAFLAAWTIRHGYAPVFSGYEVLTLIALSTTVVYCIAERIARDRRTGLFVFLVVFLLQYTSSVFMVGADRPPTDQQVAQQALRAVHSIAATFAYTALALAAIHGVLHLVGRRNLKQRKFGLLFDRLPPLELLGKICWYGLLAALAFVTVSVVTGGLVFGGAKTAPGSPALEPKVIAKIVTGALTWMVCAVAVVGRGLLRFSTARVSLIAVVGCALVAALFVASMIL